MPIQFQCDKCGFSGSAADSFAGKTGQCPKCKAPLTVPEAPRPGRKKAKAPPPLPPEEPAEATSPPPAPKPRAEEMPPSQPLVTSQLDSEVDWPAQLNRFADKLDRIEGHAKKTQKYSKATAQYTGCLAIVLVILPFLFWFFVFVLGSAMAV